MKQLSFQGPHDSMPTSPRAELEKQGFLPSGVLRSGVGTKDHPWEKDCSQSSPKPLTPVLPLCPPKLHSTLSAGVWLLFNPKSSCTVSTKGYFLMAHRTYVLRANWQKAPKGSHNHHCALEVRRVLGAEETSLFLKALKERGPWSPSFTHLPSYPVLPLV